jgi:hypothetical protein
MSAKATIIDPANGGSVVGHIDDDAVSHEDGRGTIVGEAASALKELLGQGYGRRKFHILRPASRLDNCRIVSPHVVFTYEKMRHLDVDEAPATYPEHIVDEDTPTDDSFLR